MRSGRGVRLWGCLLLIRARSLRIAGLLTISGLLTGIPRIWLRVAGECRCRCGCYSVLLRLAGTYTLAPDGIEDTSVVFAAADKALDIYMGTG